MGEETKIKEVNCPNCMGVMKYDMDKGILTCPFCGYEEEMTFAGSDLKVTQELTGSDLYRYHGIEGIPITDDELEEEIGANAFKGCSSLTSVTLPSKTTKIGANAFSGCKKLKTLKISSKNLTKSSIAKNAFKGLTKATTIKVPKKKLTAYKKLFKSKGLSSKVKVKGY